MPRRPRTKFPSIAISDLIAQAISSEHHGPFSRGCWSRKKLKETHELMGSPERLTAPMIARAALKYRMSIPHVFTFVLPLLPLVVAKRAQVAAQVPPQHRRDTGLGIYQLTHSWEREFMLHYIATLDDGHGTKWSKP